MDKGIVEVNGENSSITIRNYGWCWYIPLAVDSPIEGTKDLNNVGTGAATGVAADEIRYHLCRHPPGGLLRQIEKHKRFPSKLKIPDVYF